MIIRHPLTILTLAALLMASGAALAGGMPSDEGPEVVPEELGFNTGGSLDENTITAIIKSQLPGYESDLYAPVAYVSTVTTAEAVEPPPLDTTELMPAQICPEYVWQNVDR